VLTVGLDGDDGEGEGEEGDDDGRKRDWLRRVFIFRESSGVRAKTTLFKAKSLSLPKMETEPTVLIGPIAESNLRPWWAWRLRHSRFATPGSRRLSGGTAPPPTVELRTSLILTPCACNF
jgi:hypothetical protein